LLDRDMYRYAKIVAGRNPMRLLDTDYVMYRYAKMAA